MYSNETKIYLKTLYAILSCQTYAHINFMKNWIDIIKDKKLINNHDCLLMLENKLKLMDNLIKYKKYNMT